MLAFYLICCVFNLRVRYLYLSVCGVLAAGLLRKAASRTPLEQELIYLFLLLLEICSPS